MKWLRRKIVRWLEKEERERESMKISLERRPNGINGSHDSTTFKLYTASGGTVIETCFYDTRMGEASSKLYVITKEEDMVEALTHIVSFENLSR